MRSVSAMLVQNPQTTALKNIQVAIKQGKTHKQDWETLKLYFEQVSPAFFQKLMQDYPALTPYDLKVCAYLKLQIDSKTIANLLNITPESFATYCNRLRKKLQLTPDIDLQVFILSLQP